jgi:Leucine-rich repeat (LRR) protein
MLPAPRLPHASCAPLAFCLLQHELCVSNNRLTGAIPRAVGKLKKLELLLLSNNMLSGAVPATVGHCGQLKEVYLQLNTLQGALPSSISTLTKLKVLYVAANKLTGTQQLKEQLCRERGKEFTMVG